MAIQAMEEEFDRITFHFNLLGAVNDLVEQYLVHSNWDMGLEFIREKSPYLTAILNGWPGIKMFNMRGEFWDILVELGKLLVRSDMDEFREQWEEMDGDGIPPMPPALDEFSDKANRYYLKITRLNASQN